MYKISLECNPCLQMPLLHPPLQAVALISFPFHSLAQGYWLHWHSLPLISLYIYIKNNQPISWRYFTVLYAGHRYPYDDTNRCSLRCHQELKYKVFTPLILQLVEIVTISFENKRARLKCKEVCNILCIAFSSIINDTLGRGKLAISWSWRPREKFAWKVIVYIRG